jgi:prevent-host-death family protein
MTTSSHNEDMKSAKVSELKARLSAYLSEVRAGGSVIVYDRNTPIARLVPFHEESDDLAVIEASAHPSSLKKIKGVRPKKRIDVDKVLRELRGDR